jgi:hypothetical protein
MDGVDTKHTSWWATLANVTSVASLPTQPVSSESTPVLSMFDQSSVQADLSSDKLELGSKFRVKKISSTRPELSFERSQMKPFSFVYTPSLA